MSKKLKTFEINVQETTYGSVCVEAASRDDAIKKAYKAMSEGEVTWGGMVDHEVVYVSEVKYKRPRKAGAR